jgi:hypothetical protein
MKRLLVYGPLGLIVVLGTLALARPSAADPLSCQGGWELQCDGNVCCTVCQSTGEIGDCQKVR